MNIVARLTEPSTYAGFAAIADVVHQLAVAGWTVASLQGAIPALLLGVVAILKAEATNAGA